MPNRTTLSRSGRSSVFGKRCVPKHTTISHETAEALAKLVAATPGSMSESEFIATLIEIRVHGEERVRKLQQDRVAFISGISQE